MAVDRDESTDPVRDLYAVLLELGCAVMRPRHHETGPRLHPVKLDRVLFPLLLGIDRHGPIGVGDLAKRFGRDYTTISRHVGRLEAMNLVSRQPGKHDRRLNQAVVTTAGKALVDGAERGKVAIEVLEQWAAADVEDLLRLLRKLSTAIVGPDTEL